MKFKQLYIVTLLLIFGCGGNSNIPENAAYKFFSLSNLRTNLEFLASDELEGREATTRGEKIASMFIEAELKKYGVQPFGDNGTFFQNFTMRVNTISDSSSIIYNLNGENISLNFREDFVRVHYVLPPSFANVKDAEIVFAGYGITAAEYQYDDYENLDVKDKVVLVFSGEPYSVTHTFFNGEKNTIYSRSSTKIQIAEANGAKGVLIIPDDYALSRWQRYSNWSSSKNFSYSPPGEPGDTTVSIPGFLLSENAAKLILNQQEYSYNQLKDQLNKHSSFKSFLLTGKLDINVILNSEDVPVRNVVGVVQGRDPLLKNEYVSIGAHYDHEGIENGVIYNGANDNASGTAALLEVARALSASKQNERSVVLIFYTAEEKGLVGAKHFTAVSEIIEDIVVNINMDMLGSGSTDSLFSVGSARISTELADLVNEVNAKTTKFVFDFKFDDPNDPERIYFRSDHYQFAKKGIPSVFFTVEDSVNYHKPTDDSEHINFPKVLKVARLVYHLSLRIANLNHRLTIVAPETSGN